MGGNTQGVPRPLYWASVESSMADAAGAITSETLSFCSPRVFSTNASTQTFASAYKLSSKASSSESVKRHPEPSCFLQNSTVTRRAPFESPLDDLSALKGTVGFPRPDEVISAVSPHRAGEQCVSHASRIDQTHARTEVVCTYLSE